MTIKIIILNLIYLILINTISFAIEKENILFIYTKNYTLDYAAYNVMNGIIDQFPTNKYIFRVINICYPDNCNSILKKDIQKMSKWVLTLNCKYIILLFDSTFQFLLKHQIYENFNVINSKIIIFGLRRNPNQYIFIPTDNLNTLHIFGEKRKDHYINNFIITKHKNMIWQSNKYCHNIEIDKYYKHKSTYYFFIYWDALHIIDDYVFKLGTNINVYILYNNLDNQSVRTLTTLTAQYEKSKYNDLYTLGLINIRTVNELFAFLKKQSNYNYNNIIYNTINNLRYELYNIDIDSTEICNLIYKSRIKQHITTVNMCDIKKFNMFKTVVIDWYNMGRILTNFLLEQKDNECHVFNIRYDILE
jgi:hypothetical protein